MDLSRLLRCIAEVETGNDDTRIGKHGERSRYQIKRSVWNQYQNGTYAFFAAFCWGATADFVALRHVQWLDKTLPRGSEIERNFRHYAIAWCWNGGLDSWNGPRYSSNARINNYAVRVTNLYDDPTFPILPTPRLTKHLS